MRIAKRIREPDIDALFQRPHYNDDETLRMQDLPYLGREAAEAIHQLRPSAIIASDRSGRIPMMATILSWGHRYPDHLLPTRDHRVHFARVTSRSAEEQYVIRSVHHALERAGIPRGWDATEAARLGEDPPLVMLFDDWPVYGGTLDRFLKAANQYGLPDRAVVYLTFCGRRRHHITHYVCDPDRDPRQAEWQDSDQIAGVWYPTRDRVTPELYPDQQSAYDARQLISASMEDYYRVFDAAAVAGRIATCSCVAPNHA